jgi:hypothetical protein
MQLLQLNNKQTPNMMVCYAGAAGRHVVSIYASGDTRYAHTVIMLMSLHAPALGYNSTSFVDVQVDERSGVPRGVQRCVLLATADAYTVNLRCLLCMQWRTHPVCIGW